MMITKLLFREQNYNHENALSSCILWKNMEEILVTNCMTTNYGISILVLEAA